MTSKKEEFVISIEAVTQSIDEVTTRLKKTRDLCRQILDELEDESKLGTFAEFDFGKEELTKEGKMIHKEVCSKLESIEKQLRSLYKPMKQEQTRLAVKMKDEVEGK